MGDMAYITYGSCFNISPDRRTFNSQTREVHGRQACSDKTARGTGNAEEAYGGRLVARPVTRSCSRPHAVPFHRMSLAYRHMHISGCLELLRLSLVAWSSLPPATAPTLVSKSTVNELSPPSDPAGSQVSGP